MKLKGGAQMNLISDRYEILDICEEISFGRLYKARDLFENQLVFIQVIEESKYINRNFIPNLIDESTMLMNIKSSNISKILDVGTDYINDKECYYIVNEFFPGIELKKVIKGNYMDLNSIVKITRKILTTLGSTYSYGLYHGGLNEDNIFVDENHNIKIYDYCITKANNGVNIRKGNYIGFLSPHQLNINYTDLESDFFTLGVILFDAIFKKMPFGIGKDEKEMLKLIDKGIDWNTVGVNNENMALVNIVKKLIRRKEKYNSADEVLIDLSKFMYVKADIKDEQVDKLELEGNIMTSKKKGNKFFQKAVLLVLTVIILFIVIVKLK